MEVTPSTRPDAWSPISTDPTDMRYASLADDGGIWLFDEKSKSRVIEAKPREFRLLAVSPLDAGCMASPAVIGDALIVRTKTHLYRIDQ